MYEDHGFTAGLPDNLVYLPRLLAILQLRLNHLQCFYCEHIFKSSKVLKEHMRKKKHWRINQTNPFYDRFYLISYTTQSKDEENDAQDKLDVIEGDDSDIDDEWQDWDENEEQSDDPLNAEKFLDSSCCIFCTSMLKTPNVCFEHMKTAHGFDFYHIRMNLGAFYYLFIDI